jgi:hypothetical protein
MKIIAQIIAKLTGGSARPATQIPLETTAGFAGTMRLHLERQGDSITIIARDLSGKMLGHQVHTSYSATILSSLISGLVQHPASEIGVGLANASSGQPNEVSSTVVTDVIPLTNAPASSPPPSPSDLAPKQHVAAFLVAKGDLKKLLNARVRTRFPFTSREWNSFGRIIQINTAGLMLVELEGSGRMVWRESYEVALVGDGEYVPAQRN